MVHFVIVVTADLIGSIQSIDLLVMIFSVVLLLLLPIVYAYGYLLSFVLIVCHLLLLSFVYFFLFLLLFRCSARESLFEFVLLPRVVVLRLQQLSIISPRRQSDADVAREAVGRVAPQVGDRAGRERIGARGRRGAGGEGVVRRDDVGVESQWEV